MIILPDNEYSIKRLPDQETTMKAGLQLHMYAQQDISIIRDDKRMLLIAASWIITTIKYYWNINLGGYLIVNCHRQR